jgi:crotonobetainyl-CoA:carnitine CoA-transferase CaiB-like acyl-CoA transferase
MVLADLGADVIKVERPGRGDDTREWGPPFVDQPSELAGMSAYFASVNRNKRSLTLDMGQPAGREVLEKLIEQSDVLLENFLPAAAAKFGLEPTHLHAINPRLIVCSISGFGRTGPLADSPGYDFVVQALSGLMSITGEPDGQPMKVGVALTDVLTGLYAAVSVLAALFGRERRAESGGPEQKEDERRKTNETRGEQGQSGNQLSTLDSQPSGPPPSALRPPPFQHLDLALLDCTLASLVNVAQAFLVTGQRPVRYGNAHAQIVPYECFPTNDGHIVLAVGNDDQFRRFCAAAERDDLGKDPRFATNPLRVTNRFTLIDELQKLFRSASTTEWTRRLEAAQVPHAPVLSLDEVFTLPQVQARNMVIETTGGLKLVASPIKSDGHSMPAPAPPPRLGEHTDEILGKLGYSKDAIRQLREMGVI